MRAALLTPTGVLILLAAAGCSSPTPASPSSAPATNTSPRPTATIPADPAAAIAGAKTKLGTESARFAEDTGTDVLDFTGVVDARTRNWEITGKEWVLRRVGTDLYVQAHGKTLDTMFATPATVDRLAAGGWAHTRLPNGHELMVVYSDDFPWNLVNPATRATALKKTGNRRITGTDKSGKVTIDLDDQGRFSLVNVDSSKTSSQHLKTSFTTYGQPVAITAPPAAEVAEEENPSFLGSIGLP
ncbi:hypothetical protein [Actinoplanes sp. N902-109]|uniref:hypothetical protein n=1 Tax=Actinoplanes sp. (strain N902-109) TaxID=649831 RepID=UPI0003296848|nr:hypothetical protein [Actinoplanes sp. N902-109]AGL16895.1 hypothetical protein L083_3385 [Actinoplanes sp. N902-109]